MKSTIAPWEVAQNRGWKIIPLKYAFDLVKNKNLTNKNLPVLSLSYGKIIRRTRALNDGLTPASFSTYNIVEKDDIVLRLTDLQNDQTSLRSGIVKEAGLITSAYVTLRAKGELLPEYAALLFRYYDNCKIFYALGSGVRQSSSFEEISSIPILVPPKNKQQEIIAFIKNSDQKIGYILEKAQDLLSSLPGLRQSLITRAVTKGVDQKGFDPVSYVPFSAIFSLRRGLNITRENYQEEGVPCLSYGDVHSRYLGFVDAEINPLPKVSESFMLTNPQCLLKTGEFVFADTSEDYTGSGNCSCVMNSGDGIFAGYHTTVASPTKRDICSHYYGYYFLSDDFRNQIRKEVKGVKVFSITNTILNHTRVLFPPLKDQEEIARFLDVKCSTISKIQQKIYKEIDILTEYRSSLISAAVTGQLAIDVEATK